MGKWFPDRKVWAGGLFSVLAFFVILGLNSYMDAGIPFEATFFVALGFGKAAEYFLPPSLNDVLKRLDNDVVAIAGASPESPVSPEVGRVAGHISHMQTGG